jgi:hypothetical protein
MNKLLQIKEVTQTQFQRMSTRSIVGISMVFCLLSLLVFIIVVQKFPDSKFPILIFELTWVFFGAGGLVMVIRREKPISGSQRIISGLSLG